MEPASVLGMLVAVAFVAYQIGLTIGRRRDDS